MPNYFITEGSNGYALDYLPYCTEEEALHAVSQRWPLWHVIGLTRRYQGEWEIRICKREESANSSFDTGES
jgi:hypothetical protein